MGTFVFYFVILFSLLVKTEQKKINVGRKCTVIRVTYENNRRIDSSLSRQVYFNENNLPVLEIGYFDDGRVDYKKSLKYSADGLIVKEIIVQQKRSAKKEFMYDKEGLLVEDREYDNGKLSSVNKYVYRGGKLTSKAIFTISNKSLKLVSKEIRTYDKSGAITSERVLGEKGDTSFQAHFTYDTGKHITKYNSYDSNRKPIQSYTLISDSNGLVHQKFLYENEVMKFVVKYWYDYRHNLVKKETSDSFANHIYQEEYTYYEDGKKKNLVKIDFRRDKKEIIYFLKNGQIHLHELWLNNELEMKFVYHYAVLK